MFQLSNTIDNFKILALCGLSILSACGTLQTPAQRQGMDSAPLFPVDVTLIKNAIPKNEPFSKYGNPESYKVGNRRYTVLKDNVGYQEKGIASWYGTKFQGRRTSSWEKYDLYKMTAAHKTLPLPTYARVTNIESGKSVIVKINDRGPFKDNRIIDLSYAAASKLDITQKGTGLVEIETITPGKELQRAVDKPKKKHKPIALFIQVGVFSNQKNAIKLKEKIKFYSKKDVSITKNQLNGKPIFRVKIGPVPNIRSVDDITQSLATIGINDTKVIID